MLLADSVMRTEQPGLQIVRKVWHLPDRGSLDFCIQIEFGFFARLRSRARKGGNAPKLTIKCPPDLCSTGRVYCFNLNSLMAAAGKPH